MTGDAALRGARAGARPAAGRRRPAGHAVGAPERGPHERLIDEAYVWLNDPLNWTNPGGILDRLGEHLLISAAGGGARLPGGLADRDLARAHRPGRRRWSWSWPTSPWPFPPGAADHPAADLLGFGDPPMVLALAVFAVPPLLANAYTGRAARSTRRSGTRPGAWACPAGSCCAGSSCRWPCRTWPAGFRTAAVQVVATATLAAFVNGGGLGAIINAGFGRLDMGEVLAGGILVAVLAC